MTPVSWWQISVSVESETAALCLCFSPDCFKSLFVCSSFLLGAPRVSLSQEFTLVSPRGLQWKQQGWVDKANGKWDKIKHAAKRPRRRQNHTGGLGAGNHEQVLSSGESVLLTFSKHNKESILKYGNPGPSCRSCEPLHCRDTIFLLVHLLWHI